MTAGSGRVWIAIIRESLQHQSMRRAGYLFDLEHWFIWPSSFGSMLLRSSICSLKRATIMHTIADFSSPKITLLTMLIFKSVWRMETRYQQQGQTCVHHSSPSGMPSYR
jgi:hypothetical protein